MSRIKYPIPRFGDPDSIRECRSRMREIEHLANEVKWDVSVKGIRTTRPMTCALCQDLVVEGDAARYAPKPGWWYVHEECLEEAKRITGKGK